MTARVPVRTLRLGTRGSALALRQAAIVAEALTQAVPGLQVETEIIRTHGDEREPSSPAEDDLETLTPGEGAFVLAIESALLAGHIDLAVHSFKDMPSTDPPGLKIAAMPPREDARDVLVTRSGAKLNELAPATRIGTGSPRRRAALLAERPDLVVDPIRGNVDTRLRRVREGAYDGVVLAGAGLKRLGRESEIAEWLDPEAFIPAIGQGILAVQVRSDDLEASELASSIDDPDTRVCALAERGVALAIQAGCSTPVAAHARLIDGRLRLTAFLLGSDGTALLRAQAEGTTDDARDLGATVGARLLKAAGIGS